MARVIAVLSLDAKAHSPAGHREIPPLASRLVDERKLRGLTQAHAARVLRVAQPTYAGWEIGRATPRRPFLPAIAFFLSIPVHEVEAMTRVRVRVDASAWPALGQLVGSRRDALQWTREHLGRQVGVAPSTVAAWELGYRSPRPQQLRGLASALGISVQWLETALASERSSGGLAQLVRSAQRRLGLRQGEIAGRVGVDPATLSRWVNGHQIPGDAGLASLATAIEVPLPEVQAAVGHASSV